MVGPGVTTTFGNTPPVAEKQGDIRLGKTVKNSSTQIDVHADENDGKFGDGHSRRSPTFRTDLNSSADRRDPALELTEVNHPPLLCHARSLQHDCPRERRRGTVALLAETVSSDHRNYPGREHNVDGGPPSLSVKEVLHLLGSILLKPLGG